jgi:TRAP-type uncharacterized transport system substrate-binding protein
MPASTKGRRPRPRNGSGLIVALVALAVLAALAWAAVTIGNPFPPRSITMATGPQGSAYHEFGERYRQILARSGIELRTVPSVGGVENLRLLSDPGSEVSVAFVEGGLTSHEKSPELVSLGMVTLEPFWMFFRKSLSGDTVSQRVAGQRLSIEPEGSATRVVSRQMLALSGVDERSVELLGLTPDQSAEALLKGEIDGAMMLTSWESPIIRRLLVAEGIVLEGHPRADAYVALFPALTKVVLPMGAADLARNIPPADVPILAVETSLLVRKDLHPAVQYLLLEAASEIHGGPGVFNRAGRFPSSETFDLPLSQQARSYYKSGLPFVYRFLPAWLAGVTERLLILLIPFFFIVYPVAKVLPTVYDSIIQRRIYSLYGELKLLEAEAETAYPGRVDDEIAAALADLSRRAHRLRVPLRYAQRLFILRSHIAAAQEEIRKSQQASSGADPR